MKKGDFLVKQLFSTAACMAFMALSLLFAEPARAQGDSPSPKAEFASRAELSIRFADRAVYYPGSSESEPITIQITVTNRSPETLRFKLADDRAFSVDVKVVSMKGMSLERTEGWLRKRSSNRQVYFREMSLEPGESFSIKENVKDYVDVAVPGMYVLESAFYPELKRLSGEGEQALWSNRLTLEVKPSPQAASIKSLPISPDTAEILRPLPIPPDQVVAYLLTARQKSRWDQFYLYLDLEEMIARDPTRSRRFKAESEDGRRAMLENYKYDLSRETADKDISTIPVEFKIERTTYTETEGTVTVLEWFDYRTFREKKRFTYYLSTRDGIWRVRDYKVDNLGTE